jgi:hypothetical protein
MSTTRSECYVMCRTASHYVVLTPNEQSYTEIWTERSSEPHAVASLQTCPTQLQNFIN